MDVGSGRRIVSKSSAFFLLVPLLCTTIQATYGQGKKPVPPTTVLLVDTDDSCRLTVDDEDEGVITPDKSQKIIVGLGDHIVKCVVESIPDLVWRKVVTTKSSEQAAAIVALKALHMQYDQAVGKVQEGKQQTEAAEEKAKTDAAELPEKVFSAIKGVWRATVQKDSALIDPNGPRNSWTEEKILEFKSLSNLNIEALFTFSRQAENLSRTTVDSVFFKITPPTNNLTQDGGYHCIKSIRISAQTKNQPKEMPCSDYVGVPMRIRFLDSTHIELTWGDEVSILTKSS